MPVQENKDRSKRKTRSNQQAEQHNNSSKKRDEQIASHPILDDIEEAEDAAVDYLQLPFGTQSLPLGATEQEARPVHRQQPELLSASIAQAESRQPAAEESQQPATSATAYPPGQDTGGSVQLPVTQAPPQPVSTDDTCSQSQSADSGQSLEEDRLASADATSADQSESNTVSQQFGSVDSAAPVEDAQDTAAPDCSREPELPAVHFDFAVPEVCEGPVARQAESMTSQKAELTGSHPGLADKAEPKFQGIRGVQPKGPATQVQSVAADSLQPDQADASNVTKGDADLDQPASAADSIAAYHPSQQLNTAGHSSAATSTADSSLQTGSNRQASGLEQNLDFWYLVEKLLGMAQPVLLTWPVQKSEVASHTELAGATGWSQHLACLDCINELFCVSWEGNVCFPRSWSTFCILVLSLLCLSA